jgi:hypothetical protein
MNRRAVGSALIGGIAIAIAVSGMASAHVVKQFGTYSVALGWLSEPAYVGERNAVVVIIKDGGGNPVDDVASGDLTVTVSAGGQTTGALPLNPSFDADTGLGMHGQYTADLIPTIPGDYTFHLEGKVHDAAVDETATSSDTTFNAVEDPASVQFPVKIPTTSEISAKVDRLGARVQSAADAASAAAGSIQSATDTATAAQTAAAAAQTAAANAASQASQALLVGLLVGGAGVVIGLVGVVLALRTRKAA